MPNDRRKEVRSVQQESDREERIFTFKVTQLIWLLLGSLEALIRAPHRTKTDQRQPREPNRGFHLWIYLPVPVPFCRHDRKSLFRQHRAGTFLHFCHAGLCPDRLGSRKNSLVAILPPALARSGQGSNDNK